MNVKRDFVKKIKELRKLRGFTQVTLAEAANCSPSTIRDYENLVSFPGAEMIENLSRALKVEPYELFIGEVQEKHDDSLDVIRKILSLDSEGMGVLKSQLNAIERGMEKRKTIPVQSKSKNA